MKKLNVFKIGSSILRRVPYLKMLMEYKTPFVPPGHYYSPIPSIEEALNNADKLFNKKSKKIPGIDLKESEQMELLETFKDYYKELPFNEEKTDRTRYFYKNGLYSYSDAIFLFSIIRHFNPSRIIEIGSGYSSAVILDTNDIFMGGQIECTFVEPYPDRLLSLLKPVDFNNSKVKIVEDFFQNVNLDCFKQLNENDILFIDSSHVAKIGSDVCYYLFEVLPVLKKGVIIHIHDIFNQFEYPKDWVKEGRAWNEAYMLHAFLQYNNTYEILLFNSFLEDFHEDWFNQNMPLCLKYHETRTDSEGNKYYLPLRGQSIWLRNV